MGEDVYVVFHGNEDFQEDWQRFERWENGVPAFGQTAKDAENVPLGIVIYLAPKWRREGKNST